MADGKDLVQRFDSAVRGFLDSIEGDNILVMMITARIYFSGHKCQFFDDFVEDVFDITEEFGKRRVARSILKSTYPSNPKCWQEKDRSMLKELKRMKKEE